jgi:uncharacterized BrkB/YihY/UPF0761 family membrane protein
VALAVGLTALAGTFAIVALVLLVAGQLYGLQIADSLGLEGQTATLFAWARLPVATMLLMTAVAVLFWAAPNVDLPFKWISPGAVTFVIAWLTATTLFGLYVANFGSYDSTYGTLGGGIVLLIWLYLSSFILLLSAELNAVLAQTTGPGELARRGGNASTPPTGKGGSRFQPAPDAKRRAKSPIVDASRLRWALWALLIATALVRALFKQKQRERRTSGDPTSATAQRSLPLFVNLVER